MVEVIDEKKILEDFSSYRFPETRVSIQCFHYLGLFLQWLLPFKELDPFVSYTVRFIDDTKPIHDPRNRIFLFSPLPLLLLQASPFLRGLGKISGISRESRFERGITPQASDSRFFRHSAREPSLSATRSCPNSITQTTEPRPAIRWRRDATNIASPSKYLPAIMAGLWSSRGSTTSFPAIHALTNLIEALLLLA